MAVIPSDVSIHTSKAIIVLGFEIDWLTGDVPSEPWQKVYCFILLHCALSRLCSDCHAHTASRERERETEMHSISLNNLLALSKEQLICYIWYDTYCVHMLLVNPFAPQGGLLEARLELAQRAATRFPPRQWFSYAEKVSLTVEADSFWLRTNQVEHVARIFWNIIRKGRMFQIRSLLTRWLILSGGVAQKGPYVGVNSEADTVTRCDKIKQCQAMWFDASWANNPDEADWVMILWYFDNVWYIYIC